jgi:hypothetical protein
VLAQTQSKGTLPVKKSRLYILLFSLSLLLTVLGVRTASAQTAPSINIVSVTLLAKGAGVQVVLNGSCDAGESGVFSATVTQAARNRVASGSGFIALTCTGETQPAKFVVAASGSGAPFHVGTSLVSAGIVFGCCSGVSTTEVVRIAR